MSDLLPAEEELVELWDGLRARARGVRDGLFLVTAAVQAPDPPLASALVRFLAPRNSTESAKDLSFNLLGLEKDLRKIHEDIHLEQASDHGQLMPEFGLLIRISSPEELPSATEVMEEIDQVVQETRLGEFAADASG